MGICPSAGAHGAQRRSGLADRDGELALAQVSPGLTPRAATWASRWRSVTCFPCVGRAARSRICPPRWACTSRTVCSSQRWSGAAAVFGGGWKREAREHVLLPADAAGAGRSFECNDAIFHAGTVVPSGVVGDDSERDKKDINFSLRNLRSVQELIAFWGNNRPPWHSSRWAKPLTLSRSFGFSKARFLLIRGLATEIQCPPQPTDPVCCHPPDRRACLWSGPRGPFGDMVSKFDTGDSHGTRGPAGRPVQRTGVRRGADRSA